MDGTCAVTGSQLAAMDDETFAREFQNISVYARVQPEQKTRIVNAWRGAGYVTAMTGDGVNDAPSIKSADIGVGMGITGTDVTKNVADMILADDNFATIVSAVEEGRRIYDNIRKAIQFLPGSNMSEGLSIFLATLMGFLTMSMAEIFHSLNMRSQRQSIFRLGSLNKLLLGAALGSLVATTLVCEVPVLAAAFEFMSVELSEYFIAILLGVLVIPIVELVKLVQRRRAKK